MGMKAMAAAELRVDQPLSDRLTFAPGPHTQHMLGCVLSSLADCGAQQGDSGRHLSLLCGSETSLLPARSHPPPSVFLLLTPLPFSFCFYYFPLPLLQENQRLQQKIDTMTKEVFDLQETLLWKDKTIGV